MGNGCVLVGSKEKRTKNYSLGISSIQRIAGGGGGEQKKQHFPERVIYL